MVNIILITKRNLFAKSGKYINRLNLKNLQGSL